jgi:hypothetical protein
MFRNAAKSDAGHVDEGGCVAVRQTASATRCIATFFLAQHAARGAEISCRCTPTAPRGSPLDPFQIYQCVGPKHLKNFIIIVLSTL